MISKQLSLKIRSTVKRKYYLGSMWQAAEENKGTNIRQIEKKSENSLLEFELKKKNKTQIGKSRSLREQLFNIF